MKILYSDETGPMMGYADGFLKIEDLNPHMIAGWRMSRGEMLRTGLRFIAAAIAPGGRLRGAQSPGATKKEV